MSGKDELRGEPQFFRRDAARVTAALGLAMLGVAVTASAIMVASHFGRPTHAWVPVLGVLPIFLVIRLLSPALAATFAAWWGLCLATYPSELSRSGGFDGSAMILAVGLPALHAWLCGVVCRRVRFSPLFLAFSWVGVELAFAAQGFQQGLLGSCLAGTPIVAWTTSALGTVFVGLLAAYFGAWLTLAISEAHRLGERSCRSLRVCIGLVRKALLDDQVGVVSSFAIRLTSPRGPPAAIA